MQKIKFCLFRHVHAWPNKITVRIRLFTLIILAGLLQMSSAGYAQQINLSKKNITYQQLFKELKKQSGYSFIYHDEALEGLFPGPIDIKNGTIAEVLQKCFSNQPLEFHIEDKTVVIKRRADALLMQPQYARSVTVSGSVADETNQPLPGATVKIKDLDGAQTSTDQSGRFTIAGDVSKGVLVVSFIGYQTVELPINIITKQLYIQLKVATSELDKVEVTAFGKTSRRLSTSSISSITAEDIKNNPVGNVLEVLKGRIPGLDITQKTGQPNGRFNMSVRGATNFQRTAIGSGTDRTLIPSANPLIVVDGVVYPGAALPFSINQSYNTTVPFLQGDNGLNYLNPNDIERIDVLKDADATAIYGSRGAYGVILITTKKGRSGPGALEVNVYSGVSVLGRAPQLLNTDQYVMLRKEAIKNAGQTPGPNDLDVNGTWPSDRYTDFKKELLGSHAAKNNINLNYSGGNANTVYALGADYASQGNIQLHDGADQKGTLRFSLNNRSSDNKLALNFNGSYGYAYNNMAPADVSNYIFVAPNAPGYRLPDGTPNWGILPSNPYADLTRTNQNRVKNLLGSLNFIYRPFNGFTLNANVAYNDLNSRQNIAVPTTTFGPLNGTNIAAYTTSYYQYYDLSSLTVTPYAEYNLLLGKGKLSVKAGGQFDTQVNFTTEILGTGFASDALLNNPIAATSVNNTYNQITNRDAGFYGIINYTWDQKYIVNINGRRDGSSKFGPANRWGNFGSIALGWIFSEEKLIKNGLPFLSFGKLRASTGTVGGDAIPPFLWMAQYSLLNNNYGGIPAISSSSNAINPELQWEKNQRSSLGLELGFLKDRIYLTADYYYNKASNQLLSLPIPTTTGFTSKFVNSDGVIQNKGYEFTLRTINLQSKNFSWMSSFNASLPRNKVIKIPTGAAFSGSTFKEGESPNGQILFNYSGVNPQTGNYSYINAKGVKGDFGYFDLGAADKTQWVSFDPKAFGGFQNTFRYKQFSFDFLLTGAIKNGPTILGAQGSVFGAFNVNSSTLWLNRWQKPGDVTNIPKVNSDLFAALNSSVFQGSTGAYGDVSFVRLQNANFSYNFDGSVLRKLHVKGLNVFMLGQNLFVWSKYKDLDPESLSPNIIPPMKTITFGLRLSL